MTAGMANMVMSALTRVAQTRTGIRARVMPGARCLRIVTTSWTELPGAESSVKVIIWAQKSTRLPGE